MVFDNFYPDARPQSGISRASIVFDTLAEGGITRMLGIFLERDAPAVGPIRSARPYFVQWAAGYRALFVHAGGAPAALELLYQTPELANVEALLPHPEFYRVPDRAVPHNLYGSTGGIRQIARHNGWNVRVSFPPLPHKADAPLWERGRAQTVSIGFSSPALSSPPEYAVSYRFDRARDVYLRYEGGVPFVDRLQRTQIAAANVVVLYTDIAPIASDPEERVSVRATGRGRATVFQDGRVVRASWSKANRLAPLRITDRSGRPIRFNPGQTWIEVTSSGDAVVRGSA